MTSQPEQHSISIIAAMDRNRLIGNRGKMPWHLSADLVRFRKLTLGHTVVMGRKTFESLGRPLDGRRNIVLSRNLFFEPEGCEPAVSLDQCLRLIKGEKVFVIGGSEIFRLFLPKAGNMYLTHIDHEFEGDTYFPEFDKDDWELVSEEPGEVSEKSPWPHKFAVYGKDNQI